jgi:hypothetical protein
MVQRNGTMDESGEGMNRIEGARSTKLQIIPAQSLPP